MSGGAAEKSPRTPRAEKIPSKLVALGLEQGLFRAVAARYGSVEPRQATARAVLGWAVEQHLEELTSGLTRLGFRGGKVGKRRPRRLNQATWDALQSASTETGIPASALLRACLTYTAASDAHP